MSVAHISAVTLLKTCLIDPSHLYTGNMYKKVQRSIAYNSKNTRKNFNVLQQETKWTLKIIMHTNMMECYVTVKIATSNYMGESQKCTVD